MDTKLKVGEVVVLKSSNSAQHVVYKMTVMRVHDDSTATCIYWNQGLNKYETYNFPNDCLGVVG